MKYNFNDSTIVTGFIKELLYNFNLPVTQVYTEDTVLYEGKTYIKNHDIVKYEDGKFKKLINYIYNKPLLNITSKLKMNSSIYDSYTHNYLGNYLRFLRDYHKINLMGLYNCFSNEIPNIQNKLIKLNNNNAIEINSSDSEYDYYIVPVKFNKQYTIAIDASIQYSLMCLFYNKIFIEKSEDSSKYNSYINLLSESYTNVPGSNFNKPFLYSTYFDSAKYFWQDEKNLKLLLKVPASLNSSIVILEGNYLSSCSVLDNNLTFDYIVNDSNLLAKNIVYPTKLSLLSVNNHISYPFADRLVEFLIGNAITNMDVFSNDVKRVQDRLYKNLEFKGLPNIWTDDLRNDVYTVENSVNYLMGTPKMRSTIMWNDVVKYYEFKKFIDQHYDLTGYVDKDIESLLELM